MKKTILLLGAVGVLMMTGCADEGITVWMEQLRITGQ